jgi:hypothetical protein
MPESTAVATLAPPDTGRRLGTDELEITLEEYGFLTAADTANPAVWYRLRFVNHAAVSMQLQYSLFDVKASDNQDVSYGDYYAVAKRAYERGEAPAEAEEVEWSAYLERDLVLSSGEEYSEVYWLNKESAGWEGRSRVDIETDWIDLTFPQIKYRTTKFHSFPVTWQLVRGPVDQPQRLPTAVHSLSTPTPTNTPRPTATRQPTLTPTPTLQIQYPADDPTAEIEVLLNRWDQIHHEVDRTLEPSDLPTVLTGHALQEQLNTLESLHASRCYWIFADVSPPQILKWKKVSSQMVEVDVRKHWDGKLYCSGKLQRNAAITEPFIVRYEVVQLEFGWRIARKTPLDD